MENRLSELPDEVFYEIVRSPSEEDIDDGGGGDVNRKDRLSELPDEILYEILYLAGMRTAVKCSILSKRWRFLWETTPLLNFDTGEFPDHAQCPNDALRRFAQNFFLNNTRHYFPEEDNVGHHPAMMNIVRFRFSGFPDSSFSNSYHSRPPMIWFRTLGVGVHMHSLEQFELSNTQYCGGDSGHLLWSIVFQLQPLNLMTMKRKEKVMKMMKRPFYRAIELQNVPYMNNRKLNFRAGITEAENVFIAHTNFTAIYIDCEELKHLRIWNCQVHDTEHGIRISAPNLLSLDIRHICSSALFLNNLCSLSEALLDIIVDHHHDGNARHLVNMLAALRNANALTFSASFLQGLMSIHPDLLEQLPTFHNLKEVIILIETPILPFQITKDLLRLWPNLEKMEIKNKWYVLNITGSSG